MVRSMDEGFLYAFKYADAACEIDGVRYVLCKMGMVHKGWRALMARFDNHQNHANATFGAYPLLPHHNRDGSGWVCLYGKNSAESEGNRVHVKSAACVRSAMCSMGKLESLVRGPLGVQEVWPDLAYIIPMHRDQARAFEAVMPLWTATYLDTGRLKEELCRLCADNKVSHTETVLVAENTFYALRELFLTDMLTADVYTRLMERKRELDFRTPAPAVVEWTDRTTDERRNMLVHYYAPAYDPETYACEGEPLGRLQAG